MLSKDLAALDQVPFYFWAKDKDGVYLWGNQRMSEYAGTSVVGKTDYEITSHEAAKILRADDKVVLNTGKPHTFNEKVDDPDKGKRHLECLQIPWRA